MKHPFLINSQGKITTHSDKVIKTSLEQLKQLAKYADAIFKDVKKNDQQ